MQGDRVTDQLPAGVRGDPMRRGKLGDRRHRNTGGIVDQRIDHLVVGLGGDSGIQPRPGDREFQTSSGGRTFSVIAGGQFGQHRCRCHHFHRLDFHTHNVAGRTDKIGVTNAPDNNRTTPTEP